MSDTAIKVESLSKRYQLGTIGYGSLTHDLSAWWARVRGREDPNAKIGQESRLDLHADFWALKDVNFEVNQGARVGIIGVNGAGKSTLLKILSRLTRPTTGTIRLKGRVASLLEVGTGFHPELTGRENVFLNGAILGMKRREIQKKFDEILDFSGVEQFIDTPVKRYSSGMYVRLGFAVAAHLEPDILIIDEVLAVGDVAFQRKCLGKMEEVSRNQGRTILFVSHNIQMVRTLCDTAILLDSGSLVFVGNTKDVLSEYSRKLRGLRIDENALVGDSSRRRGSGHIRITSVSVQDVSGQESFHFEIGDTIRISVSFRVFEVMQGCSLSISFKSSSTNELLTSVTHVISDVPLPSGFSGSATLELPDINLRPGEYPLYIHVSEATPESKKLDVLDDATHPLVIAAGNRKLFDNYDPFYDTIGYFSLRSRIVQKELARS